jgi:AcrR family transcriptional regulator
MALLPVEVAADEASQPGRRLVRVVHTPRARPRLGWSPVYSNFKGKDDLFLAVLDAEAHRRFPLHSTLMLDASSIEEGLRASAREMAQYAREHPGWTGVYVEFWTHASRRPELRAKVATQHERLVETVGAMVATWAGRWGVELALPAREVVRGIYAISRGLGLETLLADEPAARPPGRAAGGPDRPCRGRVAVLPGGAWGATPPRGRCRCGSCPRCPRRR